MLGSWYGQIFRIMFRVDVLSPHRSRISKVGSREMVRAHPGANRLTSGWSIQVPARSRRVGILLRRTLEDHVLDPPLLAEAPLLVVPTVLIDHQDIRLHDIHRRDEIHNSVPRIDIRILYVPDTLHHEQPLLLGVHRLVVFIIQDRGIGADTHIQVAILRSLAEKLHMPAVQQVITSGNEYFFCHLFKSSAQWFNSFRTDS